MVRSLLSNKNLKEFISKLGINSEQEKFLIDGLPNMDRKERLELLSMLEDVYALNQDRDNAIKKVKAIFQKV
jgi:replicative superfamily II helicase